MDPFLTQLLEQTLVRAGSPDIERQVRHAMARLAAHCLRELDAAPDERTITLVLATMGRSLDHCAVVLCLGRALRLTTTDDSKLFNAFSRLAAVAYRDGFTHSLAELVELLCLTGGGKPPLQEEWGKVAAKVRTRYGVDERTVRLVSRWAAAFEHVPPWLRVLIDEQPEIIEQLSDSVIRQLHRRWPAAALWQALATHATVENVPEVQAHMLEVARDELATALRLESSPAVRAILGQWHTALGGGDDGDV